MIWRHILVGGAAVAIGNGLAVDSHGRAATMISDDLAITRSGRVEYVVPDSESSARGSFDTRHRIQEDDE